ncbi:hypothetical protein [Adhaeribacter arboris]|nr:hypothetical protein [Adhaeribacter arboris]
MPSSSPQSTGHQLNPHGQHHGKDENLSSAVWNGAMEVFSGYS